MDEQDFTNREIQAMFAEIKDGNSRIETQTKATNGKVADIQKWREQVNGGAKVAAFFSAVLIVPILGWALYTVSTVDERVRSSVNDALSAYEIQP